MTKTVVTTDFPVNGVGDREAVTVSQYCWRVSIREKRTGAGWPTLDYNVSDVPSGGGFTHIKLGLTFPFPGGNFSPGETVGYVETALADGTPSGSTTFERIEEIGSRP